MDSRHFEYFVTMMLSRNFSDAADKLGVSEAAVSKMRKTIEDQVGVPLFRRSHGRLHPTTDARRLLPVAQRALRQLDVARHITHELRNKVDDRLVIASGGPALVSLLPLAIERFHNVRPSTHIEVEITTAGRIIEMAANNLANIGIGPPPTHEIDGRIVELCNVRDLLRTELVAVLPKSHPLTRKAELRARDLATETLIGLPDLSATTELLEAVFFKTKTTPATPIVMSNAIGVCSLVQQGVGIGLVNPLMLSLGIFPGIVSRPFRPRTILRTCCYVSKLTRQPSWHRNSWTILLLHRGL